LDAELSADNVHLRHIATEAFGDMISGIGAAGPPSPPVLDPAAYPPVRLMDEPSTPPEANVLTTPFSPQSFSQSHHATYRNFVGRKNDKSGTIRAAWVTAVGYIISTSAGGIGLSREDETELIRGLVDKLNDSEEKVRLAAVKAIELFDFKDLILKLGTTGGVDKEGSIFAGAATGNQPFVSMPWYFWGSCGQLELPTSLRGRKPLLPALGVSLRESLMPSMLMTPTSTSCSTASCLSVLFLSSIPLSRASKRRLRQDLSPKGG